MFVKIHKRNCKYYYKDRGLIIEHNEYGSAYIFSDNFKTYRINNKLHNPHGPAIIFPTGNVSYYLNNKKYLHEKWLEQINKLKKRREDVLVGLTGKNTTTINN